eukprot:9459522-Alexandrium_andersonii.AAC.1
MPQPRARAVAMARSTQACAARDASRPQPAAQETTGRQSPAMTTCRSSAGAMSRILQARARPSASVCWAE